MSKKILLLGKTPLEVKSWLESLGFETVVAMDVSTGIEILEKDGIDMVLLDLILEEGNGLEFLKKLDEISSPPPIIIITSVSKRIAGKVASDEGVFAYFEKPIDKELLLKRINYAFRFKEIFSSGKVKRLPSLKKLKGEWGKRIKEILEEVKRIKIREVEESIKKGNPERALEIISFLRRFIDEDFDDLVRKAFSSHVEGRGKEEKKLDLSSKIREAWNLYLSGNYQESLNIVKELLLEEEKVESVKILNAILSRQEFEEEEERARKAIKKKREKEVKNPFGYSSLLFFIVSLFYFPQIFAPLSIIMGVVALKTGSKRAGILGISLSTVLVILLVIGVEFGMERILSKVKKGEEKYFKINVSTNVLDYKNSNEILVKYRVKKSGKVKVWVESLYRKGVVKALDDGWKEKGRYVVEWDGRDEKGNLLERGVYLICVKQGKRKEEIGVYISR
ncbi:MAG: hypothetical protein DRI36_04050 [Caldiserica bacterium]|nr:MAG: hypothetical protein DRI36_04050 [Caldisericota bacterium]